MTDISPVSSSEDMMLYSSGTGTSRWWTRSRLIQPMLQRTTAADVLPLMLYTVVSNGKMTAIAFLCGYVAFIALMLPVWLLSKLITEPGVYGLAIGTTFLLGRALVRLLVFPGSSHRVYGEIETEFARYAVRMLQTASNSFVDVASTLLLDKNNNGSNHNNSVAGYTPGLDSSSLWKRAKTYRDRVLDVFVDILSYLLDENGGASVSPYGDIGNLEGVSLQAKSDAKMLLPLLKRVLRDVNVMEERTPFLNTGERSPVSDEARSAARAVVRSATELRDVVSSFKPQSLPSDEEDQQSDSDEDESPAALRERLQRQSASSVDAIKSVAASILPMLDPPPHSSIFGLDVLRGCVLSRYRGAQQFWVRRPGGGNIDVLYIPSVASSNDASSVRSRRKAVLYCNPNAGLVEVAAGMSLAGGNIAPEDGDTSAEMSWTDFYNGNGYDVYLFNYAGFGRSRGSNLCSIGSISPNTPGILARLGRILQSVFLDFKPTPDGLRKDAATVGKHLINEIGVESLVIHGESIGGLAASGAARELSGTSSTKDKLSLLVCDRTLCNLEGVAQRLVGSWTGPAIRTLVPLWNTDVAGDFLAAGSPKVVATDAADSIIADASSLKSGVAFSREITRETKTKDICWMVDAPLEYRMADWENVGVLESRYAKPTGGHVRAPMWPADKNISLQEAFHFAACARRIGKVATSEKRSQSAETETAPSYEEEGIEVNDVMPGDLTTDKNNSSNDAARRTNVDLQLAWKALACCDGLCGAPLGIVVKESYDCTVSWLCSTLVFGGQVLVEAAEKRTVKNETNDDDNEEVVIIPSDFDCRPQGYERDESEVVVHPIPIPAAIASLREVVSNGGISIRSVDHELRFCLQTLEYVVARLSSSPTVKDSRQSLHLQNISSAFLNLHCGHNSQYSCEERSKLRVLLDEAESFR